MCCWLLVAFALTPRVALIFMWLFTDRISAAFESILLPVIGWIFLPWTTFAYALLQAGGLDGVETVILIIAVLADLGLLGRGARQRRAQ